MKQDYVVCDGHVISQKLIDLLEEVKQQRQDTGMEPFKDHIFQCMHGVLILPSSEIDDEERSSIAEGFYFVYNFINKLNNVLKEELDLVMDE